MDCIEGMKMLPDNSVDAIVTDPPYGLSFMGKKWDYDVPSQEIRQEALRVLKPGGYLLAFAGTRTQHRMAVRIEDAGFEIRDMIAWVYGSGFPKSLNIGKVLDKFLKTGNASWNGTGDSSNGALGYSKLQYQQDYRPEDYSNKHQNKEEITEEIAKEREGRGTALKPALEPITVARKPFKGTVAENVLKWGTGGINIDGCRVEINLENEDRAKSKNTVQKTSGIGFAGNKKESQNTPLYNLEQGRFPANFIHDGSDEVVGLFPNTGGSFNAKVGSGNGKTGKENGSSEWTVGGKVTDGGGSASRFFYCAKASKSERNMGCEELEEKIGIGNYMAGAKWINDPRHNDGGYQAAPSKPQSNSHPTVKPIALMEYLIKLVTKEGAIVLDPFTGSGSTLVACKKLGRQYIGYEMDADYCKIAEARANTV